MKNKRFWLFFGVVVIVAAIVIGFTITQKSSKHIIKIGAILPLTGQVDIFGQYIRQGIDLGVEEINNEKRDYKFKVIYEDSKNEAKSGVLAFNKLVNIDKVNIIISAMSGVSFPLMPLVDKSKIILFMTAVTHSDATDRSEWAFRHYINRGEGAKVLSNYVFNRLNFRKVALAYINDEGGKGEANSFISEFTKLGGTISISEPYNATDLEFRKIVLKIKNTDYDAVYISGYGRTFGIIIKQIREGRIFKPILTGYSVEEKFVQEIVGEALNNVIYYSPAYSETQGSLSEFQAKFKKKYGQNPPDPACGYAFDIIMLLGEAIKKAKSTSSEKIRKGLLEIKDFSGSLGNITILPNRDCKTPLIIKKFQNGKGERIE